MLTLIKPNKYKDIIFDLDGTLTDPAEGITNSCAYALARFDIEVADKTELNKFIGPPLYESFMKYYGLSKEQAIKAVEYYREYFAENGIFENKIYDGIKDMLITLCRLNKRLYIASSKPEVYVKRILQYFGITGYFVYAGGSTLDGSLIDKGDVIDYVMQKCNLFDKSRIVMVGDRIHDRVGAKKCNIDFIGVEYGYGSSNEFDGVEYVCNSVEALKSTLAYGKNK